MENSINTVIIRSPDQKFKDLNIQVDDDSTILDLKKRIECNHPGYPKVQRQKLIHKGKILVDNHKIESIMNENNSVVHLVYFMDESETLSKEASSTEPELRHRIHSNSSTENVMPFTYPGHSGAYPQAYAEWLQQYQQHYNYYRQYYAGQNHPYFAVPQTETSTANDTNQTDAPNEGQVPEQENVPQAAVVAEEDGQDWLDVLFALTRFFLMISVIYFYSSTYRFVIAMFLLGVIYLYQSGFFQLNRRPVVVQEPNRNPNDADDVRNNNSSESGDDVQNESEQLNAVEPPSIFASVFCFVKSFFSSLIPTGPPAVVN